MIATMTCGAVVVVGVVLVVVGSWSVVVVGWLLGSLLVSVSGRGRCCVGGNGGVGMGLWC